jgi:hypothetical protein
METTLVFECYGRVNRMPDLPTESSMQRLIIEGKHRHLVT